MFLGNPEIADCLTRAAFGHAIRVDRVTDPERLARKYLTKERTPQAGYRRSHVLGGRLKGSHHHPGSGDRVRLSRRLERDAIEAGAIEPWQHSNAKRSVERKPYPSCKLSRARLCDLLANCPFSKMNDLYRAFGILPAASYRRRLYARLSFGIDVAV
jgi:hypothetical protein